MMRRAAALAALLAPALLLAACETGPAGPDGARDPSQAEAERLAALREAVVWAPVDTARLDLRHGPPDWRTPGEAWACTFLLPHVPPRDGTPHFPCRGPDGERVRVAYGPGRPGFHGEVLGARLLWATGFFTDRVEPLRVACHGCPADPWRFLRNIEPGLAPPAPPAQAVHTFDPAAVERPFGRPYRADGGPAATWPELLFERAPDAARARQQGVEREALALLASWLRHEGGRTPGPALACAPGAGAPGACTRPVAYLSELAPLLGEAVDLARWRAAPVWQDAASCTVRLVTGPTAAPLDVAVSEPARAFLVERLAALSRIQIADLFAVAGLEGVGRDVTSRQDTRRPSGADDWADVFEQRLRQLAGHGCPRPEPTTGG